MNAHPDSATFAKANVQEIPIKDRVILALDVPTVVCTENLIRVDDVMESPKLAE